MVAEALIGADLVAGVFARLGYAVQPAAGGWRGDLIQAVCLGDPEALKVVCRAFQGASPVGAYLDPVPAAMPGYASDLVMAGGTFIDGSTSWASPPMHPCENPSISMCKAAPIAPTSGWRWCGP